MKVVVTGGGTGGHIFPAISIGEEILRRDLKNEVLFIGTKSGLEGKIITSRGYTIRFIDSIGLMGEGFSRKVVGTFMAAKGTAQSVRILREFRPDVVLGVGGYASGPALLAARLLGIPTAICEQNTIPGVTNRILGRFVKRVFAAFEENLRYFPRRKTLLVGNPTRSELLKVQSNHINRDGFRILILGGSQGAHRINLTVPKAISALGRSDVSVIHQTGERDLEEVKKTYEWFGVSAQVYSFIEDMSWAYRAADIVVGRAGAGTVAEITALGKPALLIPYPFAAYNHQRENARILERAGAAVVIDDKDLFPEKVADVLGKLLTYDRLEKMAEQAKRLGKPNAAKEIVDELYRLAG